MRSVSLLALPRPHREEVREHSGPHVRGSVHTATVQLTLQQAFYLKHRKVGLRSAPIHTAPFA